MIFSRSTVGIEISQERVSCALVSGTAASPRIERVTFSPLNADALHFSLREPNVIDAENFVSSVRSAHNLLLSRNIKVSVTLPDSVGRVMLLDLEGRFKNRAEALDLIRWKLKKNIPLDIADTYLDYQQLAVRENGSLALLVAIVSRAVISQYEELIVKAGLIPSRIDFNSFNICRVFDGRLSLADDFILVTYYGSTLGIMVFSHGIPEFVRIKDLSGTLAVDNRVFMEINSSLLIYKERFPDHNPQSVFCMASPDVSNDFLEMVEEASGLTPVQLEVKSVVSPGDSAPGDQRALFNYTASIGAALRGL